MKNVFLDCGTNLCQGLSQLINKHNIDQDWDVYSFEANPITYNVINKKKYSFVNFINKAVWIEDCIRPITTEIWPGTIIKNDTYNLLDENITDLPVGGGSNIIGDNFNFIHSEHKNILKNYHNVECFDFSNFIFKNFKKEDFIILKLDIEGSEYPVLEKMIKDKTLNYIDIMYVEWHNHMLSNKYDEDTIRAEIQKENISLMEWY
jgi:FkbM family methyltransferase